MLRDFLSASIMQRRLPSLFVALVILLLGSSPGDGKTQGAVSPGLKKLLNAVVRIDVREIRFNGGGKRTVRGVGSGVIMTSKGHILTNAHVVSPKAEEISVTLANLEQVNAKLLGWDHWTDLAVIQLDLKEIEERNLKFSRAGFGDSDNLYPGQVVYAAGTPNGLARTVTKGIISNTNRFFKGSDNIDGHETGYFNTWLQTDAAINPGNSGGPLVTADGKVVGINTRAYLGASNLAFAVPAATARSVMESLLRDPEIVRSYIGLRPGPMQNLEAFYDLEVNTGMLINGVDPGSPCANVGLRPGDIVLAIDGDPVDGRLPEQLPPIQNRIARHPVGSKLALTVKRGDEVFETSLETEKLESRVGEQWAFEDWGLSVQKVSRAMARERKLASEEGVFVIGTQAAFPAVEAGVSRGDIITKINRESIVSMDRLKEVYDAYEASPEQVLLEVERRHQVSYFVMKP